MMATDVAAPRSGAARAVQAFVPALIALAVDIGTKTLAEATLVDRAPISVVGEYARLTLGYNTGVAFGLWQGAGSAVLLLTGAMVAALVVFLARPGSAALLPVSPWPLGLVLGGALANFLDRLPDGRVTDFLDFGIGAARWPTFNLADTAIVLGVAALFALTTFGGSRRTVEQQGAGSASFQ